MRMSNQDMNQRAVFLLMKHQVELSHIQHKVSTGKKINSPADAPIESSQLITVKQQIKDYVQLQRNMDYADNQLGFEEGILQQSEEVLSHIKEQTLYLGNGSLGPTDQQSLVSDIQNSLTELVSLINAQNETGNYIFSGSLSATPAVALNVTTDPITNVTTSTYVYQGDEATKEVRIYDNYQIPVGDNANAVFFHSNILNGINGFITTVNTGGATTSAAMDTACQTLLNSLDVALNDVLATRTSVGMRLSAIDGERDLVIQEDLMAKTFVSSIEDLDYAEAVTQLEAVRISLEAAQASFVQIHKLSLFNYL